MVIGGTLLGSYRHHGLILWDYDLDVMASAKDRPRMLAALDEAARQHSFGMDHGLYSTSEFKANETQTVFSQQVDGKSFSKYKKDFLDVVWWEENATHVTIKSDYYLKIYVTYMKSTLFPVSWRPWEGRPVAAPRDPRAAIGEQYPGWDPESCSHSSGDIKPIPCAALESLYPMVHQSRLSARDIARDIKSSKSEKDRMSSLNAMAYLRKLTVEGSKNSQGNLSSDICVELLQKSG